MAELHAAHRQALNIREAYPINTVISLGKGRAAVDVADLLRMSYAGSEALLDAAQLVQLDAHLIMLHGRPRTHSTIQ